FSSAVRVLLPFPRLLLFLHDTPTPAIYTLSLHDALPICRHCDAGALGRHHVAPFVDEHDQAKDSDHRKSIQQEIHTHSGQVPAPDRKSTRLNSSHVKISYAVFCLKKKNKNY